MKVSFFEIVGLAFILPGAVIGCIAIAFVSYAINKGTLN